jgi:hypothetical protein
MRKADSSRQHSLSTVGSTLDCVVALYQGHGSGSLFALEKATLKPRLMKWASVPASARHNRHYEDRAATHTSHSVLQHVILKNLHRCYIVIKTVLQ